MPIIIGAPISLTGAAYDVLLNAKYTDGYNAGSIAYSNSHPPVVSENLAALVIQNNSNISIFLDWYDSNGILVSPVQKEIPPMGIWCTAFTTKPANYVGYKVTFAPTAFFTQIMRIPYDTTFIVGVSGGYDQTQFGHPNISDLTFPYFVQFNQNTTL
ncbi:hypothetical protein [Mucilaginibacter sp. 10B2]|uniref:hypothetical protein n=1 Tax=Mucilaginibacter sp. 10B2 TaxID=3048574 RepID=UPI002B225FC6|nr:hypothetical protein [Mucilaginibacter sp. 10B2]MEB0278960.1 hypothetical protein [Mucilaginibacter sp. 10B2]